MVEKEPTPPREVQRPVFIQHLERLSEKVHDQRSERGYGRCTEREKGLRVVCSATLQAPPTLFGQSRKVNSPKFVPSRRSMCYWGDVTPRIQNPEVTVAPAGTEASLLTLTASRRPGEGPLSFLPGTVPRRVPLPGSRARRP